MLYMPFFWQMQQNSFLYRLMKIHAILVPWFLLFSLLAALCPVGYYSSTGLNVSGCFPCPQNYYAPSPRSTSCQECPPGQITQGIQSTSVEDCQGNTCILVYRKVSFILVTWPIEITYQLVHCWIFYNISCAIFGMSYPLIRNDSNLCGVGSNIGMLYLMEFLVDFCLIEYERQIK